MGSKIGMDLWLVSMAMFIVSSLLGGLNYISTILNMRTKGMSMTTNAFDNLGVILYCGIRCAFFPRIAFRRYSAYYSTVTSEQVSSLDDIVVAGKILPNEGGSAILFQHLVLVPRSP